MRIATFLVQRQRADDQRDPDELPSGGRLPEDDETDHGGDGRQQRDHQRVGLAGEPRHRQLVADIRDDRGAHADADARAEGHRVGQMRHDLPAAERADRRHGQQHRRGQAVEAVDARLARHAMSEHDVEREQPGVGEGQAEAERSAAQADVDQNVDAGHGHRQRGQVARRPGAERGQCNHREELDGRHRAQRQPGDRLVEAAVHRRQDCTEGDQQADGVAVGAAERPPRPPPRGEHDRRARDPQPGDAQRRDAAEQQHGEGRSEVVEQRAAGEVALRGNAPRRHASIVLVIANPEYGQSTAL